MVQFRRNRQLFHTIYLMINNVGNELCASNEDSHMTNNIERSFVLRAFSEELLSEGND